MINKWNAMLFEVVFFLFWHYHFCEKNTFFFFEDLNEIQNALHIKVQNVQTHSDHFSYY